MKHDLKQQVSKLADELLIVSVIDGFDDFVSLFEQHRLETIVSLLAIPGATAGRPQPRDQLHKPGEFLAGSLCCLLGHVGNLQDEAAKRQAEIENCKMQIANCKLDWQISTAAFQFSISD